MPTGAGSASSSSRARGGTPSAAAASTSRSPTRPMSPTATRTSRPCAMSGLRSPWWRRPRRRARDRRRGAGHLAPGGWLLVEHGFEQGAAVRDLLAGAGLAAIETTRSGRARTGDRRSAPGAPPLTAGHNPHRTSHGALFPVKKPRRHFRSREVVRGPFSTVRRTMNSGRSSGQAPWWLEKCPHAQRALDLCRSRFCAGHGRRAAKATASLPMPIVRGRASRAGSRSRPAPPAGAPILRRWRKRD